MSKIINVLIVVDTHAVENGNPKVYLISDNPKDQEEGSPELTIVANVGDYIHWRATSINQFDGIEVLDFEKKGGDDCVEKPFMSSLGWTSKVVAQGKEDYTFSFSIDRKGIFTWDPHMVVTPN